LTATGTSTRHGPESWYHTIDLPDGPTAGWFDTRAAPGHLLWPSRLGRCLDVGTFDGFWAFEMERRGADEVVALDIDDPFAFDWSYDERKPIQAEHVEAWKSQRGQGFVTAASALESHVKRVNKSVYDLDPMEDGTFDVVLCGALLLHLRDPVRALERMREVCTGELILVEALDPRLDLVARRWPAAHFKPCWAQWWRVNSIGLRQLVETSGFEVLWTGKRFLVPYGPGAPSDRRFPRIHALAAHRPLQQGQLHRALRARPRPPRP
jgi:tRNA (mo5U34)-methyltransferase